VKVAPDLVRVRFHAARLEQAPAQAFAAAAEAVGGLRKAELYAGEAGVFWAGTRVVRVVLRAAGRRFVCAGRLSG
jgi:hypothetical protein